MQELEGFEFRSPLRPCFGSWVEYSNTSIRLYELGRFIKMNADLGQGRKETVFPRVDSTNGKRDKGGKFPNCI